MFLEILDISEAILEAAFVSKRTFGIYNGFWDIYKLDTFGTFKVILEPFGNTQNLSLLSI